jgi:hypothetical protein
VAIIHTSIGRCRNFLQIIKKKAEDLAKFGYNSHKLVVQMFNQLLYLWLLLKIKYESLDFILIFSLFTHLEHFGDSLHF